MKIPNLTEVWRGGALESVHRGSIAVVRRGPIVAPLGDVDRPTYPRSAVKPFQAMPVLERELDVALGMNARQVALLSASHTGRPEHLAEVRSLLARAGLGVESLECGPHAPSDEEALREFHRAGVTATPLHNNCSGKHAGMLILAQHLGAPLAGYTSPEHPVQRLIRTSIGRFVGLPPEQLSAGVDGCHAPAYRLTLRQLAEAFARLVDPSGLPPAIAAGCQRLCAAVREEPDYLAGPGILDSTLIRASRGLFCKRGAEGIIAVGIARPDGAVGIAIKVDDGAMRGYFRPLLELLQHLHVPLAPEHVRELDETQRGEVLDTCQNRVGELRTSPEFQRWLATVEAAES